MANCICGVVSIYILDSSIGKIDTVCLDTDLHYALMYDSMTLPSQGFFP